MSDTKANVETNDIEMTVDAWKKAFPNGKLRIRHSRFILDSKQRRSPHYIKYIGKNPAGSLMSFSLIKKVGWQREIYPRGGLTEAEFIDNNGVIYQSSVKCLMEDAYVKNVGIAICLNDIYNQINKITK